MIANTDCRGTPNTGLAGATLGFFIGFAAVSLFGITARHFEEVLQLGPVATALLIAAPALSGSLLRIPFAAWVDVNGGKKPLLVLLMLAGIGMSGITLLLYVGTSTRFLYVLFLLFALLSGCGIATFSVGIAQVTYWFTSRRLGGALGTYGGVGNLAPGLFSFLLPYSIGILDIKGSYLVWTIFVFVGAVTYLVLARDAWYFQLRKLGRERRGDSSSEGTRRGVLSDRKSDKELEELCFRVADLGLGGYLLYLIWWIHRIDRLVSDLLASNASDHTGDRRNHDRNILYPCFIAQGRWRKNIGLLRG